MVPGKLVDFDLAADVLDQLHRSIVVEAYHVVLVTYNSLLRSLPIATTEPSGFQATLMLEPFVFSDITAFDVLASHILNVLSIDAEAT